MSSLPTEAQATGTPIRETALAIFKPLSALTAQVNEKALTEASALERMMKMQDEGLRLNINFAIDRTGSMENDVAKVRDGLANWMVNFYRSLPEDVKDMYGGKINIGGSITYFKDMEYDMDKEPLVSEVVQPTEAVNKPFVAQLQSYRNDNMAGGMGGSESSGEALIMAMDFDPKDGSPGANLIKDLTKFVEDAAGVTKQPSAAEKFKAGCKALLESGMPPQIVILVTDELAKSTNPDWGLDTVSEFDILPGRTIFSEEKFISAWKAMPSKKQPLMMFFVPGRGDDKKGQSYETAVYEYWLKFAKEFGDKGFLVNLDTITPESMKTEDLFANMLSKTLTEVAAKVIEQQLAGLLEQ